MTFIRAFRPWLALAPVLLLGLMPAAHAVDGVTLINQATAVNGLPGCHANGLPIVICHSGSYRLAGNLVANGTNGIAILASDVSLDLNGFSVEQSSPGVGLGIASNGDGLLIRNGSVSGFATNIALAGVGETIARVRGLDATTVSFQVHAGMVSESSAIGGAIGIRIGSGLVTNSDIQGGSGVGIEFGNEGQVQGSLLNNTADCIVADQGPVNVSDNVFGSHCTVGIQEEKTGYFFTGNVFHGLQTPAVGGFDGGYNAIETQAGSPASWDTQVVGK